MPLGMTHCFAHLAALLLLAAPGAWAAGPATQPPATQPARDDTLDWLLSQATTAPAPPTTQPAFRPAAPFAQDDPQNKEQILGLRRGLIITSDGEKYRGKISTTLDKPLRVWDEKKKEYNDVPFSQVKSIDAQIVWERDEPEWHFKESGSDIKEYTGKTYPAREMRYTLTMSNGPSVTGAIDAPLYLEMPHGDPTVFILHKRDKGDAGQTLKQLIYVSHVEFDSP